MSAFGPLRPVVVANSSRGSTFQPKSALGARALLENFLDGHFEDLGDTEGDGKGRIELSALDGIDALSGNADLFGEFDLAPTAFGTQDFNAIVQRSAP